MRRRLCAQVGQTAAEYMGVLLVVSVIIAAVATTQVGTQIRDEMKRIVCEIFGGDCCLLYTSPSPRDLSTSRMPSSA